MVCAIVEIYFTIAGSHAAIGCHTDMPPNNAKLTHIYQEALRSINNIPKPFVILANWALHLFSLSGGYLPKSITNLKNDLKPEIPAPGIILAH